jgi:Pyruvate/2-oxoacid:ferredoxin oxidoreductase gamma subunit
MSNQPRTLNILIAALGGEGGGVLSDWLIATATLAGFPVQSTSIPGVAQRTGATTYYIEIFPHRAGAADRRPILALAPTPVDVDLLAASELIEAGRAMQNGFVTPERTTLVASTSRIYAIGERAAMADGRFDGERIVEAAEKLSRRAILFDMAATAEATGAPINAVLFGALIAAAVLPVSRTDAESAIRATGKSVDANLRGFAAGFEQAVAPSENVVPAASGTALPRDTDALFASAHALFPQPAHDVIELGLQRLIDYQGKAYAGLFLQRLAPIARLDQTGGAPDFVLTRETARFLALWMSYEDVIRVADLKTRADRLGRVRQDVRAGHSDVVRVVDFLKPGLDEFCSMLPPRLGKALLDAARKRGSRGSLQRRHAHPLVQRRRLPAASAIGGAALVAAPLMAVSRGAGADRTVAAGDRVHGSSQCRAGARDRGMRPAREGVWRHPQARRPQFRIDCATLFRRGRRGIRGCCAGGGATTRAARGARRSRGLCSTGRDREAFRR